MTKKAGRRETQRAERRRRHSEVRAGGGRRIHTARLAPPAHELIGLQGRSHIMGNGVARRRAEATAGHPSDGATSPDDALWYHDRRSSVHRGRQHGC
jgi:hypothetical protein